jgi:hypothetical protein
MRLEQVGVSSFAAMASKAEELKAHIAAAKRDYICEPHIGKDAAALQLLPSPHPWHPRIA